VQATPASFWFGGFVDEELCLFDSVTKNLSAPAASDASPDGPQNQIESKPAIEAVVMESDRTTG
jgi:hypothetical protein